MCFVLDINAFHIVFDPAHASHDEFEPLLAWLMDPKKRTSLVFGGEKYRSELAKQRKYLGILSELSRSGKVSQVDDKEVNNQASSLIMRVNSKNFDDAHIVAIFAVSGCRLFASLDKRADRYIKDRTLLPRGQKPPAIYRSKKHARLLTANRVVSLRNTT
jgi:predicted nucleic acid-binding protein